MFWIVSTLIGSAVALLIGAVAVAWRLRRAVLRLRLAGAMKDFHCRREYLEAKFFDLAARSGKPRGLKWVRCDFEDDVAYARDRQSGSLTALVAVTIGFSATEGGGMEHVEAVGNLRAATAVFELSGGRWTTHGRTVFNLNPTETIDYYGRYLERVPQATAAGKTG